MPGPANFMDGIADDLGEWIDDTANKVALAFAPGRAPFSANITEDQKLEYYRQRLFNPDGSPNPQGRDVEFQRLGVSGFSQVYRALINRYPELRVPAPPPIEVPEQWPSAPPPGPGRGTPGPGGPPPMGPPGLPPGIPAMARGGIVTQPTLALIGEAGPEAVVPLPDYQPPPQIDPQESLRRVGSGIPAAEQTPSHDEIAAYIRDAAVARNIDPDVALAVAMHEGTNPKTGRFDSPAQEGVFPTGRSYWPFQLHYGGPGYEQWGNTAGLGNEFTQKTGYQPGDPNAWRASVDYALDIAPQRGWYPTWYGARPAGYANRPRYGLPTA